METTNKKFSNDLSWMWHCSENPKYVLNFAGLADDNIVPALNNAAGAGFRTAMRAIEDLGLIKMEDIDRSPTEKDQQKWNEEFKDTEYVDTNPNLVSNKADHIEKCFNMHDELVKALKYARRFMNEKSVDINYIDEIIKQAEQK